MIARRSLIAGATALSLPFVITRRAFGSTIISSIGTASRDYPTISAWLGALPSNLVTDGNSYVGQCYNDGPFNELVAFTGHTTDTTHTITLTTGPGQSFRDNPSVRTNPLYYNQSNGVGLSSSANPSNFSMVSVSDRNVTISNMQFMMTGGGACLDTQSFVNAVGPGIIEVDDCIFVHNNVSVALLSTGYTTYKNCAFIGLENNSLGEMVEVASGNGNWYFCTFVVTQLLQNCFDVNPGGFPTAENCAVFGFTNTGAGTFTNCMTDVASPPSGFTGGKVFANQFVNVANDFRQKSGADLRGAGVADPTNGAFDISGFARPQTGVGSGWDIGAWQMASTLGGGARGGRLLR